MVQEMDPRQCVIDIFYLISEGVNKWGWRWEHKGGGGSWAPENGARFYWGDLDQLRPDASHSPAAPFFLIHFSFFLGRIKVSGKQPQKLLWKQQAQIILKYQKDLSTESHFCSPSLS